MKTSVYCTVNHTLALTPTLTQAINLLQLSSDELFDTVQQQLDRNPMLSLQNPYTRHDNDLDILQLIPDRSVHSLKHSLYEQLLDMHFDDRLHNIGCALIEELDENGFIDPSFFAQCSFEEEIILKNWTRQLEPKGLGATSLREALLWQLLDHPLLKTHPATSLWIDFLEHSPQAPYDLERFKKERRLSNQQWSQFKSLSEHLHFHPASAFVHPAHHELVQRPDLIIMHHNNRYEVILNEEIVPQLTLDQSIHHITHERAFKELIQEAKSFIKIVKTRFDTLLTVAQFIVEHQQGYFKQGPMALKRLILDDIAQAVGLHESTVSRIINQKLIQTPFGLKELRSLLSRSLKRQSGEDVSTESIKKVIHQLVCHENGKTPLSDQKITDILIRQGFCIARRTVTKYRKQIELDSSLKRKTTS